MVRFWRVCRGPQRAWYAWKGASRTWEALAVPGALDGVFGSWRMRYGYLATIRGNPGTEVCRTLNVVEDAS